MIEPLISVIVPIYKVEQYLEKCIHSIIIQTYKNLEIILVDDGSPDNCPKMCDEYGSKDSRIKVIHKLNGGLSDARNAGLDIAKGEYIVFVDSDDYIHPEMVSILYNVIVKTEANIVQCNFRKVKDNEYVDTNSNNYEISTFNTEQALESLIKENPLKQVVWNKLYKKEIFNELRFEVGKVNEDDFFTYQAFAISNKVSNINKELYYYLVRDTSIMGQKFSIKRLDGLEARFRRYEFIKEKYPKLSGLDKKVLWFYIIYITQLILLSKNDKKEMLSIIKSYFNKLKYDNIQFNILTTKEKIWICGSKISLELVCKMRNLFKINI